MLSVLHRLTLVGLLVAGGALSARADLVPEALGEYIRGEIAQDDPSDAAVFAEFGFEEGETARYTAPSGAYIDITAWFFRDDTGAFAAFHWVQPADAEFAE